LGAHDYTNYFHAAKIINCAVIVVIVVAWLIFMYSWFIEKWNYQKLWWTSR
jgi:hypothetical protein